MIGSAALAAFMLPVFAAQGFALQSTATSIPVAEYRQQLKAIAAEVDELESHPEGAGKLASSLPDKVSVATSTGEITVNNKTLKDNLAAFASANEQKRPGLLREIQTYSHAMSRAADYEKRGADIASQHAHLDHILARPEFKKVKEPNIKDALLSRFYRWLSKLLDKLSFHGGSNFDVMRVLIYIFVGAAIVVLLLWTIQRLQQPKEEFLPREIIPFSPSARGWRTWLNEARALAQQQDWRNAIHLAYWAGIAYLEENGAWRPNRARTPREYLRLMGSRAGQYPVLAALTRKLEIVWYGYGNASEADYQEALGQLEKLGCR